jgi:hypothetical protein
MRARLSLLISLALLLTLTPNSLISNAATSNLEIQAITDAKAGSVDLTFNSKISKASVVTYQITAKPNTLGAASYSKTFTRKVSGYISQRVTPLTPGTNYKFKVTIKTTNKKVFNSADFSFYTASTRPNVPVITKAIETDADEAVVYFDAPNNDGQTPVLYYTANAYPGYATGITLQQGSGSITLTGLTKSTTYRFTITAHNINGTSVESLPSEPIKTLAEKIIKVTPASTNGSTLAAPAFTLSRNAETRTVGIANAGYSITSSGGAIDTYTITPALPAGLTFSASTGLISGIPTETKTATTHTITAANATGSASNTLRLRVTGDIGDVGPGGGRIFYYSAAGFNCGINFTNTGSPTGEKCKYLEVAPRNWWGGAAETITTWANVNTAITGINDEVNIGMGSSNTRVITTSGAYTTTAAQLASSYISTIDGVDFNDWYLGSQPEMIEFIKSPLTATLQISGGYWTSTQVTSSSSARYVRADLAPAYQSGLTKNSLPGMAVRPIRAF